MVSRWERKYYFKSYS